jgi:hypothetical protein
VAFARFRPAVSARVMPKGVGRAPRQVDAVADKVGFRKEAGGDREVTAVV